MQYGNTQYGNSVYGGSGSALVTSTKINNQNGKSDIKVEKLQTQYGISKVIINGTGVYNLYGVARIDKTTKEVQRGRAFIVSIFNKLLLGQTRIIVNQLKNQNGKSSISFKNIDNQFGISRITKTNTLTQLGIARIVPRTIIKTTDGISRITGTTIINQTGIARISLGRVNYIEVDKPSATTYSEIDKPNITIYTPVNKPDTGIYTEVKKPFR